MRILNRFSARALDLKKLAVSQLFGICGSYILFDLVLLEIQEQIAPNHLQGKVTTEIIMYHRIDNYA